MKFLLDTNVWVSGLLFDGNEARLLRKVLTEQVLVVPHVVRVETRAVLKRLGRPPDLADVLGPIPAFDATEGLGDEAVLAAAVEAEVDFIVSGDRRLLHLKAHKGIPIVRARDALRILGLS